MSEGQPLPLIDYGKFRLSLKRLEEQHANYQKTHVHRPRLDREAVAESVIQRFETCYDCLWKVLRRYLIHVIGIPDVPNGPNPVVIRLLHKSKDSLLPRSNQERAPRKSVIPAEAGIHFNHANLWIPASAGMTGHDDRWRVRLILTTRA